MKFTEEQLRKYTSDWINHPDNDGRSNPLEYAAEWIAANLKPEEVFSEEQLQKYADDNRDCIKSGYEK